MANKKRKPGRPPKFDSAAPLAEQIAAYFEHAGQEKTPLTITGLCIFLDIDRHTLAEWEKKKQFTATIKKARKHILEYAEGELFRRSGQVAGIIFYLKNNFPELYKDDHVLSGPDGGAIKLDVKIKFVEPDKPPKNI